MSKTIAAVFDNHEQAAMAARQIKDEGLRTDDISIITKGDEKPGKKNGSHNMEASEEISGDKKQIKDNISDGVIAGGILGSLTGLLIGAGSMVIPGLGIIAAAGPITGILAGGATGAIVGGLIDLGIPENKSKEYEVDIKAGKVLFSMKADNENFKRIGEILRKNGAISVETY
ncbi:MAG: hypothetical protein PHV32_02190 [Eubacteriales bacterium]|nr:hypothetical protein [Eubacteriales bacterium]